MYIHFRCCHTPTVTLPCLPIGPHGHRETAERRWLQVSSSVYSEAGAVNSVPFPRLDEVPDDEELDLIMMPHDVPRPLKQRCACGNCCACACTIL